ncbi:SO_0444 family Cu/Zn efflux transporter [bacterium]|nr:SO_0444 family Cu/Zn efflux transporter [bacterium]
MNIIFETIKGLLIESYNLANEMSPYILFGLLIAGLLHVVIPENKIYDSFSKNNIWSVVKASLFGIPLPLCSCGVIPVAALLKKKGSGKGPIMSFLVSTPTTGVDSILATYALLGPLFTIMRPAAALFAGLFSGVITNISEKNQEKNKDKVFVNTTEDIKSKTTYSDKIKNMFKYALYDLVDDIGKWLIIGIIIGGIIGYFVSGNLIEQNLGNPVLAYFTMLVVGIPMYVCATGSIPIAASLIMKGLTPGAGLVFLIAGPATNTATISFIGGKLGKKSLIIYLVTMIFSAVLFGVLIDWLWIYLGKDINLIIGGKEMIPEWLKITSTILLTVLIINTFLKKREENIMGTGRIFNVPDMECEHCKNKIDSEIRKLDGIEDMKINLKTKKIEITGSASDERVISTINNSGYSAQKQD